MATIKATTSEKVYRINKWLGLNEHPDGDTNMRMGEASKMVNWRITRDGNLKSRPGQEFLIGFLEYTGQIASTLTEIGTFSATDKVEVYDSYSTDANPGTITLAGGDAALLAGGVLSADNYTVTDGIAEMSDSGWVLENGILENTGGGDLYTFAGLTAPLAELEPGEYKYITDGTCCYAIDSTCVVKSGNSYLLYGRIIRATTETETPVTALWSGVIGGEEYFLAACDGKIYSIYDAANDTLKKEVVGTINTDKGAHFFQFNGIVYVLNGYEYYQYDGTEFLPVEGYRPLVAIGIGPQGTADAGELTSEHVNRLNAKRRVWISPDGSGTTFQLPEKNLASIDKIINLSNGANVTGYTADLVNGTVTFTGVPPRAVNSYEIQYSASSDYRSQVTGMLFSEFFSGTTDNRIFLYGDGSNKTIYSGMDYDGMPRADYFPDQYEVLVGDSNVPITSMIRHYSALVVYKPNECWALEHGVVELATGDLTPSIYCTPVNRDRGNIAPGQVRLVENNPVTCSGSELYHWVNSSYYTSSLSRDERQARRISDRIQKSIKELDFEHCRMWDDNDNQEFYISDNNIALVWNYAVDVWYRYENLDIRSMCSFHGDMYIGSSDGKIKKFSDSVVGDEGIAIPAVWESGAMDFGAAYSRKYSAALWLGLKPVDGTEVNVTVVTDRKNTFLDKVVSSSKAKVPGEPFMVKVKIKAKKFVFYRLRLSVSKKMVPVTVTDAEIRVRMTSDAK